MGCLEQCLTDSWNSVTISYYYSSFLHLTSLVINLFQDVNAVDLALFCLNSCCHLEITLFSKYSETTHFHNLFSHLTED